MGYFSNRTLRLWMIHDIIEIMEAEQESSSLEEGHTLHNENLLNGITIQERMCQ